MLVPSKTILGLCLRELGKQKGVIQNFEGSLLRNGINMRDEVLGEKN